MSERQEQDERREVGSRKIVGQLAAADAARHRADGRRRGRRDRGRRREADGAGAGGAGDADGRRHRAVGDRDVERRELRPPAVASTSTPASASGQRDELLRVGRQPLGHARRRAARPGRRASVTPDRGRRSRASRAARERLVGEGDPRRARPPIGAGERRLEAAHEPHRRQAADAGREAISPASIVRSVERRAVDGQPQVRRRARRRPALRPAVDLLVARPTPSPSVSSRWRAWKAGISAWSMTTSRSDPVRLDADLGVVVDREVAERMGRDDGRDQRQRRTRPRPRRSTRRRRAGAGRSEMASHGAEGTRLGAGRMTGPRRASGYTRADDPNRGRPAGAARSSRSTAPTAPARPRRPSASGTHLAGRRRSRCSSPASPAARGSASGSARSCWPGPASAAAPTDPLTDALLFNAARRQLVARGHPPGARRRDDRRLRALRRLDARLPGLRRRRAARSAARAGRRSPRTASRRT